MSFLYPSFLWALFFIAIPIIIHLFNFRIHKVTYFSNLQFLTNIKDASESKSKIKNLLILLFRMLTISSLIIAFAVPFVPLGENNISKKQTIVCIYLDNSFSMNASSKHGNLFDASKERARKIVNSYNNSQKFLFVTNDFEARHRIITNKEQINRFIDQSRISHEYRSYSEIINFQKNSINQNHQFVDIQLYSYFISDFQKNIADFENLNNDSLSTFYLLPMATNKYNNIYIDSCWFTSAGRNLNRQEELIVRMVNKGDEAYTEIPIKLYINGKQKSISSFDIDSNQSVEIPLQYANTETGFLACNLEITDYPITYDNNFYFSYQINKVTSVLVINSKIENKYIQSLFLNNPAFVVDQTFYGKLKNSEFQNYQVIFLDEPENISTGLADEFMQFVAQGGVLVILPGIGTQIADINKLMALLNGPVFNSYESQPSGIGSINFDHFIYRDVFVKKEDKLNLPGLKSYFDLNINSKKLFYTMLSSISDKPMLIQHNFEKGKVFTFCFPVSESNSDFVLHPLFVPTIYNIVSYSQADENLFYTIGKDNIIDIKLRRSNKDKTIHVVNPESKVDFIPQLSGLGEKGVRVNLMNSIGEANNYFLKDDDTVLQCISFNFDRRESDPAYYTNGEILKFLEQYQLTNFKIIPSELDELEMQIDSNHKNRKEFWKLFIILALIFVAGEIMLIRLWKD